MTNFIALLLQERNTRLLAGHLPKWPGFSNFVEGGRYLMEVLATAGKPIFIKTPAEEFA
jgi:hypothetical protein